MSIKMLNIDPIKRRNVFNSLKTKFFIAKQEPTTEPHAEAESHTAKNDANTGNNDLSNESPRSRVDSDILRPTTVNNSQPQSSDNEENNVEEKEETQSTEENKVTDEVRKNMDTVLSELILKRLAKNRVATSDGTEQSNTKCRPLSSPEPSCETNYIYIQMNKSFRRITKQEFIRNQAATEIEPNFASNSYRYASVKAALITQNLFHNCSLVLQGILAGLSLAHALFAFSFVDVEILMQGYQWLAIWTQAIFYACFAVSTVDALDRVIMIGSTRDSIRSFITLQNGGFAVLIYVCGCIASISMTRTDELLAGSNFEFGANITEIEFFESANLLKFNNIKVDMFVLWRWLSVTRAFCALLGWLFFALMPSTNFTRDHLRTFIPTNMVSCFTTPMPTNGIVTAMEHHNRRENIINREDKHC